MAEHDDELRHDGTANHDGTYYHSGELSYRGREYEYEFDTPEMRYRNASIHRRPDAISSDYLTSFTVGPFAQGDVSKGVLERMWKVRVVGHTIRVSRSNAGFFG